MNNNTLIIAICGLVFAFMMFYMMRTASNGGHNNTNINASTTNKNVNTQVEANVLNGAA